MGVTLRVTNIDSFASQFKLGLGARPSIRFALKITGPAAGYALVWEWGRVDINPGPKTVWGTNPDGERVVLTKTAPNGFIRVNMQKYRDIIREELAKIQWGRIRMPQVVPAIQWAMTKAADRCAHLIAETAPYDTGQLYDAILAYSISTGDDTPPVTDRISLRPRLRRQI